MEFVGKLENVDLDYLSGDVKLTFSTKQKLIPEELESLKEHDKLRVEAVKYRKRRSLNANNYAWALMSKIATVIKTDKDSVYELMLQKYGTPYLDENGSSEKISVLSGIDVSKYGIHTKFIGKGYAGDKEFNHYIVIKGSSEYNTKEMSDFIDGVVSEAKELKIETLTPSEIKQMKESWKANG